MRGGWEKKRRRKRGEKKKKKNFLSTPGADLCEYSFNRPKVPILGTTPTVILLGYSHVLYFMRYVEGYILSRIKP